MVAGGAVVAGGGGVVGEVVVLEVVEVVAVDVVVGAGSVVVEAVSPHEAAPNTITASTAIQRRPMRALWTL